MPDTVGKRSIPVRANGLLLIVQAVGLASVCAYVVSRVNWPRIERNAYTLTGFPKLEQQAEHAIITVLVLGPPALLALVAALTFLFLLRAGWLLAMISQGATLLACLLLYTSWTPPFIYPIMILGSAMALYLNSSSVRTAFFVLPRRRSGRSRDAA